MKSSPYHGLLVLDKPGGMTSRDVVDRTQRWFPRGTRLGHTGTLDPLATGVLVICVGAATRLTEYVQAMGKTYCAGVLLGARSDTDDADGTITPEEECVPPSRAAIEEKLHGFIGAIDQVPPIFSAAKVTGRRAYDLARKGEDVSLKARRVIIYGIDVIAYDYPRLELEVRCGKGTYIRSLARDLGERLGCGALIASLRRTRVGPFRADDALRLDADAASAHAALHPLTTAVVELPQLALREEAIARLRQGVVLPRNAPLLRGVELPRAGEVAILGTAGELALIAAVEEDGRCLRPNKVLITEK